MDRPTPISRARQLRKNMTDSEKLLWNYIRKKQISGYRFLRQHPIIYQVVNNQPYYFIADFYCAKLKLVIELDGKIHDFQKDYDKHREEIISSLGIHILKIQNEELTDMGKVLQKIKWFIDNISEV